MTETRNWLLLRGLLRGSKHWGDFVQMMKAHFPKDQIHTLDLPGNGSASSLSSPLVIKDYVRFVRSQIQTSSPLHVIAVSLGAMVTLEWMHQYPGEIQSAFFVNTSFRDTGSFYERLKYERYGKLFHLFFQNDLLEREKAILSMTSRNVAAQEKWLEPFTKYSEENQLTRNNFLRQLWAASQVQSGDRPAGKIELLVSKNDNFVHPQCSYRLARKWNLPLKIHPWAGHDLVLDDPEWVLQRLSESL